MSYLISLNRQLFKNIALVGSFKDFVFGLSMSLSLSLSFSWSQIESLGLTVTGLDVNLQILKLPLSRSFEQMGEMLNGG